MLVIPTSLRSQATLQRVQAPALCWKLTAGIAGTFRFTDWPHEIQVREGMTGALQTYVPTDGVDATARRRLDELEAANKELRGIVSSGQITSAMLRSGVFDGAQVDEFLVDGRTPWAGHVDHTRYYLRSVKYDRGLWTAQVESIAGYLGKPVGDVWGPTCRVDLFSPLCGLSAAAHEQTGASVDSIVTSRLKFVLALTTTSGWATDGHADEGTLIWQTGANAGHVSNIKSYVAGSSEATITLHEPTPFDIAVSDTADIRPGCNKKAGIDDASGHCKNKFGNLVNFQGEPYIPGRDHATRGVSITGD